MKQNKTQIYIRRDKTRLETLCYEKVRLWERQDFSKRWWLSVTAFFSQWGEVGGFSFHAVFIYDLPDFLFWEINKIFKKLLGNVGKEEEEEKKVIMTWKNLWLGHARNFCCKEHSPVGVGGGGTLVSFDTYGFFLFPLFFHTHTQFCSFFFFFFLISRFWWHIMVLHELPHSTGSFLSFLLFFRLFCLLVLAFVW